MGSTMPSATAELNQWRTSFAKVQQWLTSSWLVVRSASQALQGEEPINFQQEVAEYHQQALGSDAALQYFAGRGLTQRTVERFQLGWVARPLRQQHRGFAGKPVIPYLASSGAPYFAKVRTGWAKPKPKYLKLDSDFPLPEPKVHIFNAADAMPSVRHRDVVVVEGEFDAMIAVQCGLRAVSIPGVTSFHKPWLYLFADARVLLAFDGDTAGQEASRRMSAMFTEARVQHETLTLPPGKDITDMYLQTGQKGVLRALAPAH